MPVSLRIYTLPIVQWCENLNMSGAAQSENRSWREVALWTPYVGPLPLGTSFGEWAAFLDTPSLRIWTLNFKISTSPRRRRRALLGTSSTTLASSPICGRNCKKILSSFKQKATIALWQDLATFWGKNAISKRREERSRSVDRFLRICWASRKRYEYRTNFTYSKKLKHASPIPHCRSLRTRSWIKITSLKYWFNLNSSWERKTRQTSTVHFRPLSDAIFNKDLLIQLKTAEYHQISPHTKLLKSGF